MEPFRRIEAIAVPFVETNIDTDQIIPARFLNRTRGEGLGNCFFHDLRFGQDGGERDEFILNRAPFRDARVIVAADNFGCGSSREHAVYAAQDFGIRAMIAPSFGDIFFNNSLKNGLLPIVLNKDAVAALLSDVAARPETGMTVDLESQIVIGPKGDRHTFTIDAFRKNCLLKGLDEIGFTLELSGEIDAFERAYKKEFDWV